MIDQTLRLAVERQERLRREAARGRRMRRQPAGSGGIVARMAAMVRRAVPDPITAVTILPATH